MAMCNCNQGRMPCTCRVSILLNATVGYAAHTPTKGPFPEVQYVEPGRYQFEVDYADYTGRDLQNIRDQRLGDSYKQPKLSSAWYWFKKGREDA